ncbi:MAG: hypothetical protein KAV25_00745 [Methanophagales archaeon]|nr:hypothetical protein [Methanophagales archaeon]
MQRCKYLKSIGKRAGGRELYVCEIKNIRLGSPSAGICIECENYEPDHEMPAENFIYLNWMGDSETMGVFHCSWDIFVSDDVLKRKDVETIKRWTDSIVKTSGKINLNRAGKRGYELEIAGRGRDNRCTWCTSFRTALNTRTKNLVEQCGACKFEK